MNKIQRNARREIRGLKNIKVGINLIAYFLIPFLIAVTVGYKSELEAVNSDFYRNLLIAEILVQIIFGILLLLLDNNLAVEAYFYSNDLQKENENLRKVDKDTREKLQFLILLEKTVQAFREIEVQHLKKNDDNLVNFIDIAFTLILNISDQLFHIQPNELWNFAVYIYNEENQLLESVWREKHRNHPSKGECRTWGAGQGHIGKAFSDGTAKITGDALDPNIANLMSPPNSLRRSYDNDAYRSFASIPIILENDQEQVYGVVVATSNKVNRFNKFNCLILQHLADTLASVIVLQGRKN